jgi:hypothetical protein
VATGLATGSAPASPSLNPSESYTSSGYTRRRTSWGNRADAGQDPLRSDLTPTGSFDLDAPAPSRPPAGIGHGRNGSQRSSFTLTDDPLYIPRDEPSPSRVAPYASTSRRYPSMASTSSTYSTTQLGFSTAALITPGFDAYGPEGRRSEDEAWLTSHLPKQGADAVWEPERLYAGDTERAAGSTPPYRPRVRYSAVPSRLQKTSTVIRNVSRRLRRVSLRVVNLAGAGLGDQMRLRDDDGVEYRGKGKEKEGASIDEGDSLPDLGKEMPIRGRTLGFLGSTNRFRLMLFKFLVYQCV